MKGLPEINIPPLDAVKIPDVAVVKDDKKKAIWYQVKARNVMVYGLENTTITKVKSNWEKKSLDIYGKIPRLAAKLDYSLKTKIIAITASATGRGWAEVQNFQFILKNDFVLNNHGHLQLFHMDVATKFNRAIFDLTDTNANNTDLAIVLNEMLNENWQEVWPEVRPTFETLLRENFISKANSILSVVPYKDFFLSEDAF
ncbi:circadian clock-controlled protein daywake-like [Drosophila willistoni]|uniref:circadian clock-controlled protein daywake-like n=1 Tax=Drosophila willistoni TaxID=7260 RepID=UPI000C26D236|nr:circadian clock-controlled protein daywake-like [Drosophila willistoni]